MWRGPTWCCSRRWRSCIRTARKQWWRQVSWGKLVREGIVRTILTAWRRWWAKLFALVRPDRVYLGEKDYQQIAVIKRMNNDLLFNVEIVSVPTVREDDGLAYSTRNGRLSSEERSAAVIVYKSLQSAAALWGRWGSQRGGDKARCEWRA